MISIEYLIRAVSAEKSISEEISRKQRQQNFQSASHPTIISRLSPDEQHILKSRNFPNTQRMIPVSMSEKPKEPIQKNATQFEPVTNRNLPSLKMDKDGESRKRKHESTCKAPTPVLFSTAPCPMQFVSIFNYAQIYS